MYGLCAYLLGLGDASFNTQVSDFFVQQKKYCFCVVIVKCLTLFNFNLLKTIEVSSSSLFYHHP